MNYQLHRAFYKYDAGPPIRRLGQMLMTSTPRHRKDILQVVFLMRGRIRIVTGETVKD